VLCTATLGLQAASQDFAVPPVIPRAYSFYVYIHVVLELMPIYYLAYVTLNPSVTMIMMMITAQAILPIPVHSSISSVCHLPHRAHP